jgi:diguanylate cyclase (GGDEF)-like protein
MIEMTRAATMLLALLIVHIVLGSLSLAVGRGMERPLALRYWGLGLFANAAGILIGLPPDLPYGFNKVVSTAVLAFAAVLATAGLVRNSGYRYNRTAVAIGWFVVVLAVAINHLRPEYSVPFDLSAPAVFPVALFVFAIFALFRSPAPEAKTACRFLGGILAFGVVVWLLRIWLVVYSLGGTNDRVRADFAISLFAIAQIIIAVGATLGQLWVEVRKMETTLRWLAGTDVLTGLPNRRATLIRFEEEAARGTRHQRPYSIVVFDIDDFKKVNDDYGHAYGDEVLKQVARALEHGKREVDVVGRYGGEEFVVILSEEGHEGAMLAATRLHERVSVVTGPGATALIPLTLSAGVASAPADGLTWDELFAAADRRLYRAKQAGKDRVVSSAGVAPRRKASEPHGTAAVQAPA